MHSLIEGEEATITPLFDALYHVENKDDVQKMLDEWKKLNALELKEVTRSLKKAQSVIGEAKEMLKRTWDKVSEQVLTILDESNYSVSDAERSKLIDEDMRLIEEFHRTANHAVTDLCKLFEVIEASADAGRTGGRLAEE